MAQDISKLQLGSNEYLLKDTAARTAAAAAQTTADSKSIVSGTGDATNWATITIDGTTKNIPVGGGGEPTQYLKTAAVEAAGTTKTNPQLTITNKDNTTVTYNPDFTKVSVAATGTATDEVQYITIDGVEKKLAGSSGGVTDVKVGTTSVVSGGVATLKALANKDDATGTVPGQTISGVKATGTLTSAVDGDLGEADATATITTHTTYTPVGTVSAPTITVTEASDTIAPVTDVGTMTAIDTTKFNGGSAASLSAGFVTAGTDASLTGGSQASITDQTTGKFVKKAFKFNYVETGSDAETLEILDVASTDPEYTTYFTDAVTDRGTFTTNELQSLSGGVATVIDMSKFNGGTPASLSTGFYTAGSVPTLGTNKTFLTGATATSTAPTFTGTADSSTIPGSTFTYKKSTKGTLSVSTELPADGLAVGDIVVTDKSVTVS